MRENRHTLGLLAAAVTLLTLVIPAAGAGGERSLVVRDGCPTFSWPAAEDTAIHSSAILRSWPVRCSVGTTRQRRRASCSASCSPATAPRTRLPRRLCAPD